MSLIRVLREVSTYIPSFSQVIDLYKEAWKGVEEARIYALTNLKEIYDSTRRINLAEVKKNLEDLFRG